MKVKRLLKIIQFLLSILFIGLVTVMMYYVVIIEESSLEYRMLVPLSLIIIGVLSLMYQIKTLKYYRITYVNYKIEDIFLWVSNGLFAFILILLALYFGYEIIEANFGDVLTEYFLAISVCVFPLLLGLSLFFEERYLYKRLKKIKSEIMLEDIKDIKGNQGNVN